MDLAIGTIVLYDGATLPYGWYDCDGTTHNGLVTPDLIGAFPRAVPSGGTLGTAGGSATHLHSNPNTSSTSHGHAAGSANSGGRTGETNTLWAGSTYESVNDHAHLVSVAALSGQENHFHTMPDTDPASSLPPYIRLRYIIRCE